MKRWNKIVEIKPKGVEMVFIIPYCTNESKIDLMTQYEYTFIQTLRSFAGTWEKHVMFSRCINKSVGRIMQKFSTVFQASICAGTKTLYSHGKNCVFSFISCCCIKTSKMYIEHKFPGNFPPCFLRFFCYDFPGKILNTMLLLCKKKYAKLWEDALHVLVYTMV